MTARAPASVADVQEVAGPLGHVRVRGTPGDLGAGSHRVVGGAAHPGGATGQDRPVRALAPVGHADAGIPEGIRDAPDASRDAHQGGNRG
jgi:hypothetical protein